MRRIGIIGAMADEVAGLKELMQDIEITRKASMEFYAGTLEGKNVVVVQTGIGKVNAAVCTQILADDFQAEVVIIALAADHLRVGVLVGKAVADAHGRNFADLSEVELKRKRNEIRHPHFSGKVADDAVNVLGKPAEEIFESLGFFAEIVERFAYVLTYILIGYRFELGIVNRLEAALFRHLTCNVFEDIVHENAHLGRGEARWLTRLCL